MTMAPRNTITLTRSLSGELGQVLHGFEQVVGLSICFRPLSGGWRDADGQSVIPYPLGLHVTPFCLREKGHHLPACRKCDVDDLPRDCAGRTSPFVRRCHAGADEMLVPLTRQGSLIGVVFIGQFRRSCKKRTSPPRQAVTRLPVLNPQQIRQRLDLARLLPGYLLGLDETCRRLATAQTTGTKARILRFLDDHIQEDIRLPDMAEHLGLSVSRTGHLVREQTGQSFRQLKTTRLLAAARNMLATHPGKLSTVAGQLGFRDANYFSRFFRKHTGHSPGAFRRGQGWHLSA